MKMVRSLKTPLIVKALVAAIAALAVAAYVIFSLHGKLARLESAAGPDVGEIAATATKQGVPQCTALIDRITQPMLKDSKVGADVSKAAPGFLSYSLEVDLPQGGVSYVSISAAAMGKGCVATVESVAHWTDDCDKVYKSIYAGAISVQRVRDAISVLSFGAGKPKIFMMPVAKGCIAVKRQSFSGT